ncbi:FMN-dependent NADH-azoreductase [Salinisphaera shabanensis T35B1]
MTHILRIDASARQARSLSRILGDLFIQRWQQAEPEAPLIRRDVGTQPPPAISEAWIAAAFTPG